MYDESVSMDRAPGIPDQEKGRFLQRSVLPEVRRRIGVRGEEIARSEQTALGFLVDRRWENPQSSAGDFMRTLGLDDSLDSRGTQLFLAEAVGQETIKALEEDLAKEEDPKQKTLIGQAIHNAQDLLKSARKLFDSGSAVINFGGVPRYLQPPWVLQSVFMRF